MKVISYDQWRAAKIQMLQEEAEELRLKCSDCNGDGIVECDMGHEHDCTQCRGTGAGEDEAKLTAAIYQMEVFEDVSRLAHWVTTFKAEYWPEFDRTRIAPYQDIKTREFTFSHV